MINLPKKTRNILLIVFGVLFLVLAFLPTIIKNYAVNNSKELLGRQIDIGKLKYNYFSSTVRVYDFKLFEANDTDLFTTFDTLVLNLEPLQLIKDKIEIEEFHLTGLMVNTVLKDSTFNFDDLIAFHSKPKDSLNTKPEDDEPFKYSISDIQLNDANFYFDNKNVGKKTAIEEFSLDLPFIGWDQEEKSNADIQFNFKKGGYFKSALNVNPVDGEFDAVITIKDLYLQPFYEYVSQYTEINDINGRFNSVIKINGNTKTPTSAVVSGDLDVSDFIMIDKQDKAFLKAKQVQCHLGKIEYDKSSYVINELKLTEPYIYFEMDSVSNNFFRIFKIDTTSTSEADEKTSPKTKTADSTSTSNLYYAINTLKVDQGILDYSDNLTGERFDYHLSDITVDSKDIKSDADWVDITSDMVLNNRGTLNAKLGLNPSDFTNLNLDFSIENFLLSDINVYSSYYTGHNILEGDFYYYSKSIITNGDIQSENQLLIKNVSVSNEDGGLYSLPLKFALFILKDKNGDVNLDIPVRGDMNDPSVSVGKIVWNTFKNLIIKTAASPVNFLAGLIDGDPKDLSDLEFEFTDSIPSEKHYRKLDKLLQVETKKEGLAIELKHIVDPDLQKEAIAFKELGKQYFKDTEKDYLKDTDGFENYLHQKVVNDSLTAKEAAFEIFPEKKADSLAQIYNEALIRNTNTYLKTTKPDTKITAVKADEKDPENKGSQSKFKIQYDLLEKPEDQELDSTNQSNNYEN